MATLDRTTLQRLRCAASGLGGATPDTPRALLARTGWVRTLGGIDAYLSLRARQPGLTVAAIHAALASGDIEVVPAARGCIYLVARDDAPLARALARDLTARRMVRDRAKAGYTDDELAQVSTAVLAHLAAGPASTANLRRDLPAGTVRSLGAAGKKVGLSSTLPHAVRMLELEGRIVRRTKGDSLDHEHYLWHRVDDHTPTVDPRTPAERHADLVRRLLRWLGPTSLNALASFTGLGKRVLKTALAGDDIHAHTAPGETVLSLDCAPSLPPASGVPHFLPGLDTLFAAHGGPSAFLDPADADRPVWPWGRQKGRTWGTAQHVLSRAILVDGRIAGAWEVDPDTRGLWVQPFSAGLPGDLEDARTALAAYVWEGPGHGRAFSIDSDDRIRGRRDLLG